MVEAAYRLHGKRVFNLALNYCQSVEEAEEITQDVFMRLHDHGESFRGDAALSTWLYRITVNLAIDRERYRTRQRRWSGSKVVPLHDLTAGEVPRHFEHPGVALEDQEAMAALFAQINKLPPKQKAALLLLKVEGLSQREAADVMEASPKSVESLFERAKRNLADLLAKAAAAAKDR